MFSRHHIPTNSVATFSTYKATHNPQFLQSLWWWVNARKVSKSAFYFLWWLIFVFNSVDNIKLPFILYHRRSSTVSLETYPLYSMSNSVQMRETSIFEVLHLGSCLFLCNFNRASNSRFKYNCKDQGIDSGNFSDIAGWRPFRRHNNALA